VHGSSQHPVRVASVEEHVHGHRLLQSQDRPGERSAMAPAPWLQDCSAPCMVLEVQTSGLFSPYNRDELHMACLSSRPRDVGDF
jgi:hypothetical protein